MKKQLKWTDYMDQTVNARFAVERYIDGADVPVLREGEVTIGVDPHGDIMLEIDGDFVYPFDDYFELLPTKP